MSTAEQNLKFWNEVCKTDPDQTRPIEGREFNGTSVKPLYIVQKVTSVWGPIGLDWGFEEIEYKITDGIWFSKVRVWFQKFLLRPGAEGIGEITQWGGTIYMSRNADNSVYRDDNAAKKSFTDGLTKAFSYLGFAADVHMGKHDDNKYVTQLRNEKAARKQGNTQPPAQQPQQSRQQPNAVSQPASANLIDNLPPLDGVAYKQLMIQGVSYMEASGETRDKAPLLRDMGFQWSQRTKSWLMAMQ